MHNWYKVLGTTCDADHSQIKSSFRNLAKTFHPDLNAGDKRSEERFKQVNQAYEVLRDPSARAKYDALLASNRSGTRQRWWKAAAMMSACSMVCVAVCFSLVIWLMNDRPPIVQDQEVARQSDSKPVTPIPRIESGASGAAGHAVDVAIAIASPLEPNKVPDAHVVGAEITNKRILHDRWFGYRRKLASYTSKLTPAAVDSGDLVHEPDRTSSPPLYKEAELAQGARLLSKAAHFLDQGNIVIAREYLARAAALGVPIAALRLAETHDPHEHGRFQVHGLKRDPAEAKRWYKRAIELGANDAEERLRRLAGQ
jgi:DnaJ domain